MNTCVIMSIYKGDTLPFVKESVDSILNQTFTEFDFLIKLDGEINSNIECYLKSIKDNRVKLFFRKENQGLAVSLNELIEYGLVKGYTYFFRMDADDISHPKRFEIQQSFMEKHLEVDVCGTWLNEVDEFGDFFYEKKTPVTHDECCEYLKKRNCFAHPTVIIRNTFFKKAGNYDSNAILCEDLQLWAKGLDKGCRYANLPEFLFSFRVNSKLFDRRRGIRYSLGILKVRIKIIQMLGWGYKEYFYALMTFFLKIQPTFILKYLYKRLR